jgi:pyridoxamine 5'-phosphate oxidase
LTERTDPESSEPGLDPADLGDEPVAALRSWLQRAVDAGVELPEAMALATSSADRGPSVRMVLLRGIDDRGLRFFTNYESAKAADLAAGPRAALLFHWHRPLHRQVRVEGGVEKLTREESAAYFATRPPGSRVSAWASPQSRVVADREELERRWQEAHAQHDRDPTLPPFWGGYRVVPDRVEFWQSGTDRLHDRVRFRRDGDRWVRERLAP